MIHLKPFYLFSLIILASFIHTDLLALRCTGKCGNVIILSTSGFKFFDAADRYFHVLLVIFAFFLVVSLLVSSWIAYTGKDEKKQKLKDDHFEQNGGNLLRRKLNRENPQLIIFTDQELKSITKSYTGPSDGILRCCTKAFFRGSLPEDGGGGGEVAVVEINRVPRSQIKRFVDQMIYLAQPEKENKINTNLVRLIGACLETHSPLLVYALHGDGGTILSHCARDRSLERHFTREKRVKAAAGVARGFASFTKFMHGNICTDNILMDGSFGAKIFYAAGSVHEENDMYTDPEFLKSGRFNDKSDVYSFGVVLVELLTGRGDDPKMVSNFVNLAKAGRISEILDEEMKYEGDVEIVREFAALAEKCLDVKPSKRPNMKKVEETLSEFMKVPSQGQTQKYISEDAKIEIFRKIHEFKMDLEQTRQFNLLNCIPCK